MFTFTNADAIATLAEDNGQLLRGENIFAIGRDVLAVNAERVWFFRSQLCVVQVSTEAALRPASLQITPIVWSNHSGTPASIHYQHYANEQLQ